MVQFLERMILKKIDNLIGLIIEISSEKSNNKAQLKEEAVQTTLDLIPLLLHFLEGNISHVEPMLQQLIREKLPNPQIISSFGNFQTELNNILKEVLAIFLENPQHFQEKELNIDGQVFSSQLPGEESVAVTDDNELDELPINLNSSVLKAFPNEKIIFNYQLRGQIVDVYIPNQGLALISAKNTNYLKLNYLCKKAGLNLLQIPHEVEVDYRRLLRFIKRKKR